MDKDEISKEIEATESRLRALREKLNAPVEKEYRAGEWVPECGDLYYYVFGIIDYEVWDGDDIEKSRLSQGNVYPTEAIAEAAKKHNEWWTKFDMADEGGNILIVYDHDDQKLSMISRGYLRGVGPAFINTHTAGEWITANGGESYVSEMLAKGRVFRFKWGGE